jgi:hypothetical protein
MPGSFVSTGLIQGALADGRGNADEERNLLADLGPLPAVDGIRGRNEAS